MKIKIKQPLSIFVQFFVFQKFLADKIEKF